MNWEGKWRERERHKERCRERERWWRWEGSKGGHGWHSAAVCAGTAAGRSSTPALSPVPADLQADCHLSHSQHIH